ncbi:MAG: protease modulator HflK [Verrucomicrobia bacterium]|nr:protease modulator HflK [Verrucomicrobiota bacterium]
MERNHQKTGLINWLILLVASVVTVIIARYVNSAAGWMGAAILGIGFLAALVSYFQVRLEEGERLEKLEFNEVTKSKGGESLFVQGEESFPAQRSRIQFERFFVPGFAILLMLLEAAAIFGEWKFLEKRTTSLVEQRTLVAASLFALQFLVLFIFGKYASGFARATNDRLLRPAAGYLLLGAYTSLALAAAIALSAWAGYPQMDLFLSRVLAGILGLIAIETLLGLLLEIYRPRVKGKPARVLYESRLVGLLGEPEGIFKTAAHALDYQFGFKVSETWFYRFLEKTAVWLVLLQLLVLLLSTSFVFVETGDEALLERFGKPVAGREVLGPGLHVKLPFPVDQVHRYNTEKIQTFTIGIVPDEKHKAERTVLWSVSHEKEENMLVASHEAVSNVGTNNTTGKKSPPVNLLSVSIPVQFQVTNLTAWAYNNEAPDELLERLATREVVRYLVSVDLLEIMSQGRAPAAVDLKERIQTAADQRDLGALIVFVGLQDIHPPVAVAEDYQKVVGTRQAKEAAILNAQAFEFQTNALARAEAFKRVRSAEADKQSREVNALANAALFTNQLPAYAAAPTVYAQRKYLETFARASKNARKYVIATTNTQDVIQFDLQDKIRTDLLDVAVPPTK